MLLRLRPKIQPKLLGITGVNGDNVPISQYPTPTPNPRQNAFHTSQPSGRCTAISTTRTAHVRRVSTVRGIREFSPIPRRQSLVTVCGLIWTLSGFAPRSCSSPCSYRHGIKSFPNNTLGCFPRWGLCLWLFPNWKMSAAVVPGVPGAVVPCVPPAGTLRPTPTISPVQPHGKTFRWPHNRRNTASSICHGCRRCEQIPTPVRIFRIETGCNQSRTPTGSRLCLCAVCPLWNNWGWFCVCG